MTASRLSILGASGSLGSLLQASLRPPPNPLLKSPCKSLALNIKSSTIIASFLSTPLHPSDLIVVTTKSYDTLSAISTLPHKSSVLVLCNGLVPLISDLRQCKNIDRLYVGTTSIGARKLSDIVEEGGTVRRIEVAENGRGTTVVGKLGDDGNQDGNLIFMSDTMNSAGFGTEIKSEAEVLKALWIKMFVNCLINPGCAVRGVANGEAVLEPKLVEEVGSSYQRHILIHRTNIILSSSLRSSLSTRSACTCNEQ